MRALSWYICYSQSDTSVFFTNADGTLHTVLYKVIVTDDRLKDDVVIITEIDHDVGSGFLVIVHT